MIGLGSDKYKYKHTQIHLQEVNPKRGHSCAAGLGSDRYKYKCKIQIQIQMKIQNTNTHKYTCRKHTQNVVPVVQLVWVPNNCYRYVVTFFFTEICFRSYRCFAAAQHITESDKLMFSIAISVVNYASDFDLGESCWVLWVIYK